MYDFDGFERREMALQNNAQEDADNINAQIAAEAAGDNVKLAELEKESARIWAEKQAIYDGDIAVQTEVANRGLDKEQRNGEYVVVLDTCEGWLYLQDTSEVLTQDINDAMRFETYDEAWQIVSDVCAKKENLHKYSKGWVKNV